MRPRQPVEEGTVDQDGTSVHYEVFGAGEHTLVLLPPWMVVHSRIWKAQIAGLSDHFRIVTYDARGCGRSDRPTDPSAYVPHQHAADALAVMSATRTDQAVLVGNSYGGLLALLLAASATDLVEGAVFIGPSVDLAGDVDAPLTRALATFDEELEVEEGWGRYNRHAWARDFPGFVRWFTETALAEPHATKPREEALAWGLDTTPEVLTATVAARAATPPHQTAAALRSLVASVTCPSLVIQGGLDVICPPEWGRRLATGLGSELVEMPEAAHCPQVRYPIEVNRIIRSFMDRRVSAVPEPPGAGRMTDPDPGTPSAVAAIRRPRPPRVLYLSSPIGLGHARRDLAIATELRTLAPDVRIDWLAQDPVTRVLDAAGETVHPASLRLASESAHLESEMGEHDLHVFEALRRMDEILVTNFSVFADLTESAGYDLVVGDESWEVDHFLHEHPALKRARFAWLSDFVGIVPMASGGEREAFVAADWNREMIGHVERRPHVRDLSIFVGDPDDVVPHTFGAGLPSIAEWTAEHYEFSGYITGFDPAELDHTRLRAELGYRDDEVVVIASVGGSAVGLPLLRRIVAAHPLAAEEIPGLRTVIVTGPRIDPGALPDVAGVEKRAFVPDLHRHLAACDLAVVQGGLTTTMELTAAQRPFVYLPLLDHFEQQIHVRHRLDRHGAGRALEYAAATPEALAAAMADELRRDRPPYRPVPRCGARRAASLLVELL
ncbi:alpha/beta hydrolase [Rhabdothermincola salaria]|uniref:alpha/beta hydrolase n=1 Tax=Rhabdothermincola salaria TaxID=2903142 RepID=UPI001E4963F6|nr:alpha/beta hydrolase [Rhabdothermincola salaria]MCD9625680.1 alpha/beta fold hydrolase [Rhabdothermincola salaria]